MFTNLIYLHIYDNESDDEEADDDHSKEPWVVDMCRFMTLDDTSPNVEKKNHNQPSSSCNPMEKTLVPMGDVMQKIINEVNESGVQLIDHNTSLLSVIAIDI
jgi:hypothetical protein